MNEQNDHIWMHKKPETVFDWLAIIAISIALYLMLGHLNVFAGGIAKFLDVVAPFASGIVIAYVLDCIVRPVQRYVMKENPKLRWLSILIAYIVAALIITLLVSMVVPQVVSSITMLFTNLPLYISNVQNLLDMLQNRYGLDLSRATEMLDNYESMMNSLTEVLKSSAPQIMAYVSGVASNVVDIFTALASSVYMLAEKTSCCASCAPWCTRFSRRILQIPCWKPAALPTTILKAFLAAKSLILLLSVC